MTLAERLLRRRPDVAGADRDGLERALRERIAAARRAWPGIAVGDEAFVDAIGERLGDGEPAAGLAALCVDDLYLACACAAGDARALAAFERRYEGELAATFRSFAAHGSDGADLRQVLLERLFVGHDGRPPRIAEYGGRGSLRAWLKIAAVRLRIDRERVKGDRRDNFADEEDAIAQIEAVDDPELRYLKTHYREQFKAAFVAALGQLEPKERALLRLNAVERLSATDIARIYNVHRATAKRWLADARERLVAATQRLLAAQLGDRAIAVASILRLIHSDLDLSLARHLA
jgi:RNA polymerase sigma-70 factor (ECF subfamily)